MLLTITTTHRPATDLGYLLHKNPGKAQTFDLSVGKAHAGHVYVTICEACGWEDLPEESEPANIPVTHNEFGQDRVDAAP